MAQINVSDLTFSYEGSFDNIFEHVSFTIDTDWKLGFIGRNGKGKTTFLNLLLGKYDYKGSIQTSTIFEYFPYRISKKQMKLMAVDIFEEIQPDYELWRVLCELEKLRVEPETLYRPYETLSQGERTKVMLALLFSSENYFLLIDEPTNHLDKESREIVKEYLNQKKGFILVSHDRDLLDTCIDHVLVLNRSSITVEKGNFSSWWENRKKRDAFEKSENEKHKREIRKLEEASRRTARWAEKSEGTKIGFDTIKEHDRNSSTRAYIGAKTKKMNSRMKQIQQHMQKEIKEKEGLLKDVERPVDLKIMPLTHHKEVYIWAKDYGIQYMGAGEKKGDSLIDLQEQYPVFLGLNIELRKGERVLLQGKNGCGKSTFIKAVLAKCKGTGLIHCKESGVLETASGLIISYMSQDTSFLKGSLNEFARVRQLDESLFKAILRQLDFERVQFTKNLEEYSEGQKKKVLVAASLLTQAHLYIWDEPLNYIDVFSRIQIEDLILRYQPTMLLVEHDVAFVKKVATRIVRM